MIFHLKAFSGAILLAVSVSQAQQAETQAQGPAKGETLAQFRARETDRLIPLKKVTVGPDDQYNADLDRRRGVLVFTEKSGLVASLRLLDLANDETMPLLPVDADSEEAIFGPSGLIAFTYFKFNARGDICYVMPPAPPFRGRTHRPVSDKEIRCLERPKEGVIHQRSNPFWRSAHEVGYLERDLSTQTARVVVEDIKNKQRAVLTEGFIWSPSMRPGGRFLTYLERKKTGRQIILKDLETSEVREIHFPLPGFSGFPTISPDEKYLYFSHFLNDTNGDQLIDGADNGVIFRAPINSIQSLPEQLTSIDTSCGFPRVVEDELLITCAFEGSLDIYSTAVSGVIPANWDRARITNAIDTSRSYQDRLLLLNAAQYRFSDFRNGSLIERLFTDHVLAGDVSAARFYLKDLRKSAKGERAKTFELFDIYLKAREIKKTEPDGETGPEFRRSMSALSKEVRKIKSPHRSLVEAYLKKFVNDLDSARSLLKNTNLGSSAHMLEWYLYFDLTRSLYLGARAPKTSKVNRFVLEGMYKRLIQASAHDEQSKLYYVFSYLADTEKIVSNLKERLEVIRSFAKNNFSLKARALLDSEVAILEMLLAPDQKTKAQAFQALDKFLSSTRDDYFLRRALYVRAILNFNRPSEITYLGVIARNWLRYTNKGDTEFAYARDVFADNSLTQAYAHLGKNELLPADNYFFESLTLTDDLESHYGFIVARTAQGRRSEIEKDYATLEKRNFIGDNMKFVKAALELLDDAKASIDKHDLSLKPIDRAIALLEAMTQDRNSAIRHLLLGYAYMEKLLRSSKGYNFDSVLLQKSHRELMLAYDLGWDNDRIRASALMNLGILHRRVRNHGLASRFFEKRKALGFISEEDRARFEYLYANTLAYNHQSDLAAIELKQIAPEEKRTPHEERLAFYLATSGSFLEAADLYETLIDKRRIDGDENLAKAHLVWGYSLIKAERASEARKRLLKALEFIGRLKTEKRFDTRGLDFEPKRLALIAHGLLSQHGSIEQRLFSLQARYKLLDEAKRMIGNLNEAKVQNRTQIAELFAVQGRHAESAHELREALRFAEAYGEKEQFLGKLPYRTAVNFMAHLILHPEAYSPDDIAFVEAFVEKCRQAYVRRKLFEPVLDMQNLKLQILLTKAKGKIGISHAGSYDLLKTETASRLRSVRPDFFQELESLARL